MIHGCEHINGCEDLTLAMGHKFGEDMICRNKKWLTTKRVEHRYILRHTAEERRRIAKGENIKRRYSLRWVVNHTYDQATRCGTHWLDHRRNPVPCQWPQSLGPVVRYADVPLHGSAA